MSQHDPVHKQKKAQAPSAQGKSDLQRAAVNSTPLSPEHIRPEPEMTLQSGVKDTLNAPGQPLDDDTRAFMEPRFGHDFSHVRVHTDSQAAESARSLNALAYTVGNDIVFGAGQYVPETTAGEKTIAHELTHVVQQASEPISGTPMFEELSISRPSDGFEQTAKRVANEVKTDLLGTSQDMSVSSPAPVDSIQGIQTLAMSGSAHPVIQRQGVEEITFEPETITISAKESQSLLSKAGWKRTNVQFILKDFEGLPISGYKFFAQFTSSTGEETTESAETKGGILTLPQIWLKPQGSLRLMGVAIVGIRPPSALLEGPAPYKRSGENMVFVVQQKSHKGTISAKSKREATDKVAAEGSIGFEGLGVKISGETSETRGTEQEQQWEVLRGQPGLEITQIAT